jgi:hypothetical protein
MTTYRCKRNKNVFIFSTLHRSVAIDGTEKKKPETIQFYNATKFGVDVVDQMARKYSVKASSRRWPVQVFYNVLDLAAINAWVLYKETTNKRISRRKFILQLRFGSVLGPLLFTVFINDIDQSVISSLLKFADDAKLFRVIYSSDDVESLRTDLGKLFEWSKEWLMLFNVEKCKVMHLGRNNDRCSYSLDGMILRS